VDPYTSPAMGRQADADRCRNWARSPVMGLLPTDVPSQASPMCYSHSTSHRYTMTGIAEWLASIGLGEDGQGFAGNAIDLSVVDDLTEQDLKALGVLLGHRRKILRAIAELKGEVSVSARTGAKPAPRDSAERRQLTVMFCDLVDSSALSARLDP